MRAIREKCSAIGTPEFQQKESECSEVLTAAFRDYQHDLRIRIASLPRSSKQWWKLNRELLNRKTKSSTISPIK
jgi:hypothetical protein